MLPKLVRNVCRLNTDVENGTFVEAPEHAIQKHAVVLLIGCERDYGIVELGDSVVLLGPGKRGNRLFPPNDITRSPRPFPRESVTGGRARLVKSLQRALGKNLDKNLGNIRPLRAGSQEQAKARLEVNACRLWIINETDGESRRSGRQVTTVRRMRSHSRKAAERTSPPVAI